MYKAHTSSPVISHGNVTPEQVIATNGAPPSFEESFANLPPMEAMTETNDPFAPTEIKEQFTVDKLFPKDFNDPFNFADFSQSAFHHPDMAIVSKELSRLLESESPSFSEVSGAYLFRFRSNLCTISPSFLAALGLCIAVQSLGYGQRDCRPKLSSISSSARS